MPEILQLVLHYVPAQDLAKTSLVSRLWRDNSYRVAHVEIAECCHFFVRQSELSDEKKIQVIALSTIYQSKLGTMPAQDFDRTQKASGKFLLQNYVVKMCEYLGSVNLGKLDFSVETIGDLNFDIIARKLAEKVEVFPELIKNKKLQEKTLKVFSDKYYKTHIANTKELSTFLTYDYVKDSKLIFYKKKF